MTGPNPEARPGGLPSISPGPDRSSPRAGSSRRGGTGSRYGFGCIVQSALAVALRRPRRARPGAKKACRRLEDEARNEPGRATRGSVMPAGRRGASPARWTIHARWTKETPGWHRPRNAPPGPDLRAGIATGDLPDGRMMAGHADGEAVLLAHRGNEWFAIGAACSHYSGPLPEGLMVGDTVRCPWHHACFNLRTGQPVRPPALNDLPRLGRRGAGWHREGGRQAQTGSSSQPVDRRGPSPSSSWVEARPVSPQRRHFGARGSRARSPSWTRIRTPRTIGRTSPRTIWPGTPRKSGSRCIRPSFIRRRASS